MPYQPDLFPAVEASRAAAADRSDVTAADHRAEAPARLRGGADGREVRVVNGVVASVERRRFGRRRGPPSP